MIEIQNKEQFNYCKNNNATFSLTMTRKKSSQKYCPLVTAKLEDENELIKHRFIEIKNKCQYFMPQNYILGMNNSVYFGCSHPKEW